MKTEQAIEIVGQLEDFLNIPSFLCEYLQKKLEEEHYQEVIEYIIQRKNEIVEKENKELKQEIERLQEDIGNYVNIVLHERKEIDRLHSIIKEVREYIESYMPNYDFDKTNLKKLLEILDKEKDNE